MALNPADIATVSRLLDEALALEPAEREPWLASLPVEHQRHVDALRDMLAQEAQLDTDPRLAAMPKLATDDAVAHAGDRIGPYRLLHEIGRGGMGSVWLAERADGAYKRQVALKLPRLAWGAGLAERMAREREIGALLEHPHIARLYDAGVDARGRPFIAMAYIDGEPIDVYCRERSLGVRARLKLFVQVVRAVAYAHGRLVIHRDLKPANVLVDTQGQTHLLDFGIAKLIDEAAAPGPGLTEEQGRVMTPHYASPEQIAGRHVGVQADVYSLGVLLYELLTGRLPYDLKRQTVGAIEEAILQAEPAPASIRAAAKSVARALKGEIDSILAKAMKREPGERYATADALAEDIERHLAGETVKARPDSPGYRLRKALTRHRFGFAATAAVLLAVLLGGGATLLQAQRALQQAERAQQVTEFVNELFRINASRPPIDGAEPEAGFLDQGARLIQTRFPSQPDIRAQLYGTLSNVYSDLGVNKLAVDYAKRQVDALHKLPADDPRLARALIALARACQREGQLALAEESARKAEVMARSEPALLFEAQGWLATLQLHRGKVAEAQAWVKHVEDQPPAELALNGMGLFVLRRLQGNLLIAANRLDDGLVRMRQAVDAAMQFEGPASRNATELRLRMATNIAYRGSFQEAKKWFDDGLEGLRLQGGIGALSLARYTASWASAAYSIDKMSFEEALTTIRRSRATVAAAKDPPAPPMVLAEIDQTLATLHRQHGDLMEAAALYASSLPLMKAATDDPGRLASATASQGYLEMMLGRHAAADQLLRESLEWRQKSGALLVGVVETRVNIASNLMMQGAHREALSFLADAPDFPAMQGSPMGRVWSMVIPATRTRIRLDSGDVQSALAELPDRSTMTTEEFGTSWWREVTGATYCATGQFSRGLPLLLEEIAEDSKQQGSNHPKLAHLRATAALCAWRGGDRAKARALTALARSSFDAQPGVSDWFKQPLRELDKLMGEKSNEGGLAGPSAQGMQPHALQHQQPSPCRASQLRLARGRLHSARGRWHR